ncbi:unnamed protein product [Nippostrongylus brasiliensis]|uniref:AAI domain-containing protein n=1 Tax=Nippostrongylus brasiliensis TaxID=27835 RepID=A0A0N4Y7H5_NIPBR|nr:unnamed protein product [Nippostrongylus brasiliensis]
MLSFVALLALVPAVDMCVPTQAPTTTTTNPCCSMLSQSSLPKRNPTSSAFEQCSILRRMSSTCPVDGIVFCDAAPDTNPSIMQIEFFNAAGNVVRSFTNSGNTLAVNVMCCPILSTTSLPKVNPSNLTAVQQCSILRRMSSTCPTDGLVFCDAAQETNVRFVISFFLSFLQFIHRLVRRDFTILSIS